MKRIWSNYTDETSFKKPPKIKYDDIVDTSNFKSSRELIRDKSGSNSGEIENPHYDYKAGETITEDNRVTDIELALRNNKLDKADVQKLQEMASENLEKQAIKAKDKKLLDEKREAQRNRDKKLDEMLDVNQEKVD